MTWTLLKQKSYVWPKELTSDHYKAAEKSGKMKDVFKSLDRAESTFKKLDPPYEWVTTNKVTHMNWQILAKKFLEGPSKELRKDMLATQASIKSAQGGKVALDENCKSACKRIAANLDTYIACIKPETLDKEIAKLIKHHEEGREAAVKKKTGSAITGGKEAAKKSRSFMPSAAKKLIEIGLELKDAADLRAMVEASLDRAKKKMASRASKAGAEEEDKAKAKERAKKLDEELKENAKALKEATLKEQKAEEEVRQLRDQFTDGLAEMVRAAEGLLKGAKAGFLPKGMTEAQSRDLDRIAKAMQKYADDKAWPSPRETKKMERIVMDLDEQAKAFGAIFAKVKE